MGPVIPRVDKIPVDGDAPARSTCLTAKGSVSDFPHWQHIGVTWGLIGVLMIVSHSNTFRFSWVWV